MSLRPVKLKQIPVAYYLLLIAFIIELSPLFYMTIPPGCDTSMHGYITRLIVNNNGLPHSYRPILPVDYFGSYSAGYHVFTALVSGMQIMYLRHAINFVSLAVYPLTLLGLVFLLKNFFSEKIAIYTALAYFGINRTIVSTIDWGGNPTILSFAFCLFAAGLFLLAVRQRNQIAIYCTSVCVASIPLVHAIPAIAFIFIAPLGYVLLLIHQKEHIKWILTHSVILAFVIVLIMTPFLLHFKNENSPELLKMIKNWQLEMMRFKLTGKVSEDLFVTMNQIKYRLGDVLAIITGVSIVAMLFFKKQKQLSFALLFVVYIFILVFNSGYWFLPVSELLYPERVVFFMVPVWAFIYGCFLEGVEARAADWVFFKGSLKIYYLVIIVPVYLSLENITHQNIGINKDGSINCNKQMRAGFDWVNKNTEKDAVIIVSYAGSGMWVPTFTNRATIGAHLHFIHEILHIEDFLLKTAQPKYYFVTKNDFKQHMPIVDSTMALHKLFANEEVTVFKK